MNPVSVGSDLYTATIPSQIFTKALSARLTQLEKKSLQIEDVLERESMPKTRSYPSRPPHCTYTCLYELYQEFSRIFLQTGRIDSACGHTIMIFDHHFFHMAAIEVEGRKRLFMAQGKEIIMSIKEGFGYFKVLYGGSRARNLASAYATIAEPDEVWEKNPRCTNARWVYIKQFASAPYAYTVALVTDRPEEGLIVPVSSFPCNRSDVKKWRGGKRTH